MAVTHLRPMHLQHNGSLSKTLSDAVDYSIDKNKTDDHEYIGGHLCEPLSADAEFHLPFEEYLAKTGRKMTTKNVATYHMVQSFSVDENISPELANKIGMETALELFGEDFPFVIGTHVDKAHVHNDITVCAVSNDATRKFKNPYNSYKKLRSISDKVCKKHGISIIEEPKKTARENKDLFPGAKSTDVEKPIPFKLKIRHVIDEVLLEKPKNFEDYIRKIEQKGIEVKRGKHLSFKAEGQERFTRLRTLGEDYSEQNIRKRLADFVPEFSENEPQQATIFFDSETEIYDYSVLNTDRKLSKTIDIAHSQKAQTSGGYRSWAHDHNIKMISETMLFMSDNGIQSYKELKEVCDILDRRFNELKDRIDELQERLDSNKKLQDTIFQYRRTKDIFDEYKAQKYSKKFYEEHKDVIDKHRESKKIFNDLGLVKIPTVKTLKAEFGELISEKSALFKELKTVTEKRKSFSVAEQNMRDILSDKRGKTEKKQGEKLALRNLFREKNKCFLMKTRSYKTVEIEKFLPFCL